MEHSECESIFTFLARIFMFGMVGIAMVCLSIVLLHVDDKLQQVNVAQELHQDLSLLGVDLHDAQGLIRDARYSTAEINHNTLAARKLYEQAVPQVVGRLNTELDSLDKATNSLNGVLLNAQSVPSQVNLAVDQSKLVLTSTDLTMAHLDDSIKDFDSLLRDEHLKDAIVQADITTQQAAVIATNGAAISRDAKQEVHNYTQHGWFYCHIISHCTKEK